MALEQNSFGNKLVLVTGASGLVGSHLIILLLSKGIRIRAFVRNLESKEKAIQQFSKISTSNNISLIDWFYGDITIYEEVIIAMEEIEYVFHCAGFVSFAKSDSEQLLNINFKGTRNVVNAAIEKNIIKLCHVSSVATIGKSETGDFVDESCSFQMSKYISPYNYSKYLGELEVWRGIAEGLTAVIVNPSVILGIGNPEQSSTALFGTIAKGLAYYTPGVTGYVSVHDVVECMYNLTFSTISNQRFILSAENLEFKTVFTNIANSIGAKPPTKCAKLWQVIATAFFFESIGFLTNSSPKINRYTFKSAFSKTYYSSKKIQETLPFTFRKIDEEIDEIGKAFKNIR